MTLKKYVTNIITWELILQVDSTHQKMCNPDSSLFAMHIMAAWNTFFCSQSGINARLAVLQIHSKPYNYPPMTTVILNLNLSYFKFTYYNLIN